MRNVILIFICLASGVTPSLAAEPTETEEAAQVVAAIHMRKGQELMKGKKFEEAEREFDLAILSYSEGATLYGQRGQIRFLRKNYSGAVEDFSRYLVLVPDDPDVLFLRGLSKSLLVPEDVVGACADLLNVRDRAKELNMDTYCHGQAGWPD